MYIRSLWNVFATVCFALAAYLVNLLGTGWGTFELLFWRSAIGFACMWMFMAKSGVSARTEYPVSHFVRSLLGCLSIALWFWSLPRMDFGANMTLAYTTPIFLAIAVLAGSLFRREAFDWSLGAVILAGFAGVVAVMQPAFHSDQVYPALVDLSSAVAACAANIQINRLGRLGEPSRRIVFYFTPYCSLIAAASSFLLEGGFHFPNAREFGLVLLMGLLCTAGQFSLTQSFAAGNVLLSACLSFLAIPFSALLGVLLNVNSAAVYND